MLVKWTNRNGTHMVNVPDTTAWYIHTTLDVFYGTYIYLRVGELEFPICCSDEYTDVYTNLTLSAIADLFDDIINVIYLKIIDSNTNYLDVDAITTSMRNRHWHNWIASGYVTEEMTE